MRHTPVRHSLLETLQTALEKAWTPTTTQTQTTHPEKEDDRQQRNERLTATESALIAHPRFRFPGIL
jgi:hypothetical protein